VWLHRAREQNAQGLVSRRVFVMAQPPLIDRYLMSWPRCRAAGHTSLF